ncbi:MAG TPA: M1 family aminopeptidase [Bacteroidales bacterium]|nr:M1 family aminopeptidase [Bacteroidales bacterium]HSA42699.1 M1 family aminopeptidase [Bacteroidales bacterium]
MNFKVFLLTVLCLGFLQTRAQDFSKMRGSEICHHRKSQIGAPEAVLSPNSPKHSYDVLNYSLTLDLYDCFINPYPNNFDGTVIITFRVDSVLNSINLNAVNTSLVIQSVSLAGVSFSHTANILTIMLDRVYNPGEIAQVQIEYEHQNVTDNAFYASGGLVFTDCEPEGARKWFPCWDKPSDKAKFELFATVPLNVKLGSNGRLEDSTIVGNQLTYHWISRDPLPTYLAVLSGKVNYNLDIVYWTNPANPGAPPTPIRFYYNQGENPSQMKALIGDVCSLFSEKFGEHPFEKNGFATLNNQFSWGGMENQTLTSLCPGCWYESLIVHEFAHQWFGDMVTCATWADIFLNEGFATYLEAIWLEHSSGYAAYKDDVDANADSYFNGNPGWPIVNPSWAVNTPTSSQLFNYSITYAKGACVLHMLRYVMGDSLFFQGVKDYATDTVNIKYQSARVIDLQEKMENAYGQSLDWFFDEWLMQPNHPVYQNSYNVTNLGNGQWKVNFFAKQTQTNTVFFNMPLELRVKFTDGTDTIFRVMNDVNNQLFSFIFLKQPQQLTFDPADQIVLKQGFTNVAVTGPEGSPMTYGLTQNFPNPFREESEFYYTVPEKVRVRVQLTDAAGRMIREIFEGEQPAGTYGIQLSNRDLKPGVYFYTLRAGDYMATRSFILLD